MSSNDPNKAEQKPVTDTPQKLSDLPPKAVSDDEGAVVKGGPTTHPWQKPLS